VLTEFLLFQIHHHKRISPFQDSPLLVHNHHKLPGSEKNPYFSDVLKLL